MFLMELHTITRFSPQFLKTKKIRPIVSPYRIDAGEGAVTKISLLSPRLFSGLEQLEGIPIGIEQLDLLAARSDFHLISKLKPLRFQLLDARWKIGDTKHHAIPSSCFLTVAVRHRT